MFKFLKKILNRLGLIKFKPNFIVDDMCSKSLPCSHDVSFDGGKTYQHIPAENIIQLYREQLVEIPEHFKDCVYWIDACNRIEYDYHSI